MSSDAPIIASAVVIPPNATLPSPPHRLKRRESTSSDTGPSKRTRISSTGGGGGGGAGGANPQDEKSRSQRLFGSILGNLGRVNQDTRTRKRQEVEAKMQEKMRVQMEEERADAKRSREVREEERKVFAGHAAQVRRRNESHMANFLTTKSKPKIYYRPWKLLRSQEIIIEKQKEMAARNRTPSPEPFTTTTDSRRSTYTDEPAEPLSPTSTRSHTKRDIHADDEMDRKEDAVMDEPPHPETDDQDTKDTKDDDHEHDHSNTHEETEVQREPSPVRNLHPGDEEEEMVEY